MSEDMISKTREFVKEAFIENPHYSFDHWSVMYDHAVTVERIAMEIAEDIECDKLLVSLGALLHDIGKTYKADSETLYRCHESFNWKMSEGFIRGLGLPKEKEEQLKDIILYKSDSAEMKIIKDADALAMYADKRLHMLYIEWVVQSMPADEVRKKVKGKLERFSKLNFEVSRKIGKKWFEQEKKDWDVYLKEHAGIDLNIMDVF